MNDCCEKPENRGETEQVSDDLSVTRCLVCDAKHFELVIDEGDLVMEVPE